MLKSKKEHFEQREQLMQNSVELGMMVHARNPSHLGD